ncbi:MAG: response regulator transcription factor [Candidatus Kapabacteria bacterium]|nr:response regulator transcription factor [Candidatus Kapabacteria bacterium]MBX7155760.1 LytTR family DNA-binding domain-containing protein [Bacteroidota bacterium]
MRILIIDDEKTIQDGIVHMLHSSGLNIDAIYQAFSVDSGIETILHQSPDVVLLDVEIGKETGFDLLRRLNDYSFQLIFITAHNEYAVQAFKFSAIDFLLKPIDPEELVTGIKRAEERMKERFLSEQLSIMRGQLESLKATDKKIVLRDNDSLHFVKIHDIIKCEADSSYTKVYLINSKPLYISRTLKDYETMLAPYGFVRTHHSHIVNIHRIVRFDKNDGGGLVLEGDITAPVSQRKKEYILSILSSGE